MRKQIELVMEEDNQRLKYLEETMAPNGNVPSTATDDLHSNLTSTERRTISCAAVDPALAALNFVVDDFRARSATPTGKDEINMPFIDNVPVYDAWVPVRTNFWVGKDMELEPYMPYFGDDTEGRTKAFDLFKDMAQDAKQENQLSDGEVDGKGELIEPPDEEAWIEYESLSQVRWRAACRASIMRVFDIYDESVPHVLDGLSAGLEIEDKARLKAVIRVAQSRREEKQDEVEGRKQRAVLLAEVRNAMKNPEVDKEVRKEGSWTSAALTNFCFTCQVFHCRQHEGRDVEPMIPIADPWVDSRLKKLRVDDATACSTKCFLVKDLQDKANRPKTAHELTPWTPEEIMVLREATAVFKKDPCSLATIVGTRSCQEIVDKWKSEPMEEAIMRRTIADAEKKRTVNLRLRSQRMADVPPKDNESDVEDIDVGFGSKKKKKSKKSSQSTKKAAHKRVDSTEEPNENEDFLPCYHSGPCTFDSCTCVKRNLGCESTCCCNCARYGIGLNGQGIARYAHASPCGNLSSGCACKTGHCNTDKCPCWQNNQACNPDICEHCDCKILPSQLSSGRRQCRNVAVSVARHKRTYVGKSPVHGYGLFAGDHFEQGDLVGIYGGQLLDTRLADMVGRLYDAKDHTFFFDITETIVIDGGVLGMKTKFCNHTHGGNPDENVHSKMIRVRGEAHIALFTKRPVKPGEELKFDYKFQSVVPPWAKAPEGAVKEEPETAVVTDGVSKTPGQRRRKSRSKRT